MFVAISIFSICGVTALLGQLYHAPHSLWDYRALIWEKGTVSEVPNAAENHVKNVNRKITLNMFYDTYTHTVPVTLESSLRVVVKRGRVLSPRTRTPTPSTQVRS